MTYQPLTINMFAVGSRIRPKNSGGFILGLLLVNLVEGPCHGFAYLGWDWTGPLGTFRK